MTDTIDRTEIKQIAGFLNNVQEGLCEGDEETVSRVGGQKHHWAAVWTFSCDSSQNCIYICMVTIAEASLCVGAPAMGVGEKCRANVTISC